MSVKKIFKRRRRNERGAVAVLVAMLALVLLAMGALSVDLGNAFVHKHDMQKRTDFAALAGAAGDDLPQTAGGGSCSYGVAAKASDQAIQDVATYLSVHYSTTVTAGQLVDCNTNNGEAGYGTFSYTSGVGWTLASNQNQISVISQQDRVDFGMARVLGFNNVNVEGVSTVEIKTPTMKTLPMYISQTCRWGQQTIAQPTNGHSSDGVNLASPNDNNTYIVESALSTNPASTASPPLVQMAPAVTSITVTGTNLDQVTQIGFFESDPTSPPAPVTMAKAQFTSQTATSITVQLPSSVTSKQDTWFVRLFGINQKNKTTTEWTPVTNKGNSDKSTNLAALPITVGNATLTCTQGSNSGNFGTLDLFNTTSGAPSGQWQNIGYNIAKGLQYGLAPYPKTKLTPGNNYTCVDGQDNVAATWPGDGTNCVGTKTGLDSNAAQAGFIDGISGTYTGLLNTTDGECPFNYPSGTTHQTVSPTSVPINNDVLSCFFKNDTVTVGDVSSQAYSGGVVIDQSIYDSPRFVLVPVLGTTPDSGSSNNYEIIDFQPGFITDEPSTATRATGPTTYNGFTWSNNNKSVSAVNVVFLNPKALPDPPMDPEGHYIPYVGSGRKVPLLVN